MFAFSLVTGAIAFALFAWAATLIVVWAVRPAASPSIFLRALVCVGICIICVLAGMSSLSGDGGVFVSQVIYLVVGAGAMVVGMQQTLQLLRTRHVSLERRPRSRR